MAIKKIKIGNTTHDIQDGRIAGVTSSVSDGLGSVVTSDGVFDSLGRVRTVNASPTRGPLADDYPVIVRTAHVDGNISQFHQLADFLGCDTKSTISAYQTYLQTVYSLGQSSITTCRDLAGMTSVEYFNGEDNVGNSRYNPVFAHQIAAFAGDSISFLEGDNTYMCYRVFENNLFRLVVGFCMDTKDTHDFYFAIKSTKRNILWVDSDWGDCTLLAFEDWLDTGCTREPDQIFNYTILRAVQEGMFDAAYEYETDSIIPLSFFSASGIYAPTKFMGMTDQNQDSIQIVYLGCNDNDEVTFKYKTIDLGGGNIEAQLAAI